MRDFGPFLTKRIQEFRNLGTYLASRWALLTNRLRGSAAAEHVSEKQADLAATDLGDDTIKYLGDLANESFKRQLELDETVWRSLPFFAATFAFVATIIGKSAEDVPQWGLSFAGNTALIMLVAAVFSLAWALRWFWVVLRPREYEYPAPDHQVKEYAVGMRDFYAASGVTDAKALDTKTLAELRLFMIDQYGSAAATNLRHNATKLKARPKVLLFMLLGFALAFLCEALIFMNTHVGVQPIEQGVAPDGADAKPNANTAAIRRQSATEATGTPEVAAGEGRRELLGRELQARNPDQAVSRNKTPPRPPSGSGSSPQRPTPPMPQVIAKDSAFNRGGPRPTPTPPKPPRKD